MLKYSFVLLPLFLLLLIPPPSIAMTGSELLSMCEKATEQDATTLTQTDVLKLTRCTSYIVDVAEGWNLSTYDTRRTGICVPDEADGRRVVLAVRQYLLDHPQNLHAPANMLVVAALERAFPCNR